MGQNHWNVKNDFMAAFGPVLLVLSFASIRVSQVVVCICLVPMIYTDAASLSFWSFLLCPCS